MENLPTLLLPADCALLLIDHQAGLAFGVGSIDRQVLRGNTIALVRTAKVFGLPVVVSTSATKVYSGPFMPAVHALLPDVSVIERRSMNVWEDDAAHTAVKRAERRTLLVSGLLTEACVTFAVAGRIISARRLGRRVVRVTNVWRAAPVHRDGRSHVAERRLPPPARRADDRSLFRAPALTAADGQVVTCRIDHKGACAAIGKAERTPLTTISTDMVAETRPYSACFLPRP